VPDLTTLSWKQGQRTRMKRKATGQLDECTQVLGDRPCRSVTSGGAERDQRRRASERAAAACLCKCTNPTKRSPCGIVISAQGSVPQTSCSGRSRRITVFDPSQGRVPNTQLLNSLRVNEAASTAMDRVDAWAPLWCCAMYQYVRTLHSHTATKSESAAFTPVAAD
jgi:hypothetical protein